MLSGIKTGKRKKSSKLKDPPHSAAAAVASASSTDDNNRDSSSSTANDWVAEQLRQALSSGKPLALPTKTTTRKADANGNGDDDNNNNNNNIIVINRLHHRRPEEDLTAAELAAQERADRQSWQEREVRDILRMHKKRKVAADSDEEVETAVAIKKSTPDDEQKATRRDRSRQVSLHDKQQKIASKCWWWLESPSFSKHRLLAVGDYVSLVWAPLSVSEQPGHHFYLVPVPHVPALNACDDHVWNEITRFQKSLKAMFDEQQQQQQQETVLLFCETVLPTSSFWQTRLEAIVVPKSVGDDAPLFFKTALNEQAEEWGTHQKLLSTKAVKGLRRTIPPNFSYFYIEFPNGNGFVQLIESNTFPRDFGIDTIGGMMQLDPLRFRGGSRKRISESQERQHIQSFLDKWKEFDWTVELDKQK